MRVDGEGLTGAGERPGKPPKERTAAGDLTETILE